MSDADADALADQLGGEAPEQARRAIAGVARETPVLVSGTLSERCGGSVVVKAEKRGGSAGADLWWEVGVAETSGLERVRASRARYEAGRKRQKVLV